MTRRRAKVDDNQPEIVAALRKIGATVTSTAGIGKGFPDLAVGYRGVNYFFEVKDGNKPPSARRLTPDELAWHELWRGSVHVVESVEQALNVVMGN